MRAFRFRRVALTAASCSLILIVSKLLHSDGVVYSLIGFDYTPDSSLDCIYKPCSPIPVTYGTKDLGDYIISGTLHVTLSPEEAQEIMRQEQSTSTAISNFTALLPELQNVSEQLQESQDLFQDDEDQLEILNDARSSLLERLALWRAQHSSLKTGGKSQPDYGFQNSSFVEVDVNKFTIHENNTTANHISDFSIQRNSTEAINTSSAESRR